MYPSIMYCSPCVDSLEAVLPQSQKLSLKHCCSWLNWTRVAMFSVSRLCDLATVSKGRPVVLTLSGHAVKVKPG